MGAAAAGAIELGRAVMTLDEVRGLTNSPHPGTFVTVQGHELPANVAHELMSSDGSLKGMDNVEPLQPADMVTVKLMRELLAEAVGTGFIVLLAVGSVCASLSGSYGGLWHVAVVHGFGVSLALYCTVDISGAHLNPAVTLAFLLVRPQAHGMTVKKALLYVVAQFTGAFICSVINYFVFYSLFQAYDRERNCIRGDPCSIRSAMAFGMYFPNPINSKEFGNGPFSQADVTPFYALCVEAWATAILCFFIMALTNDGNKALGAKAKPGAPFMIGFLVCCLLMTYAPITMTGINPVRDLAPRLVAWMAGWGSVAMPGPQYDVWVYTVGPMIGAPFGAWFGELALWRRITKTA